MEITRLPEIHEKENDPKVKCIVFFFSSSVRIIPINLYQYGSLDSIKETHELPTSLTYGCLKLSIS